MARSTSCTFTEIWPISPNEIFLGRSLLAILGLTDQRVQKFQHRHRSWPAFLRMREQRNLMRSRHVHDVRESGHCRFDDVDLAEHCRRENVHARIMREEKFRDIMPAHVR